MNNSIGRFVPGNSVIHRLDPRVKLVSNIILIVLVFIARSFLMQAVVLTPVIIAFLMTNLRKTQIFKMLKPVIFIGVFLFIINIFILHGITSYYKIWKLDISYEAVHQTLIIMFRIYTMILVTTILTATTKPTALTKAIEDLLLPLKIIKVPVHIIAMIISIALRFIPTLMEESQRIMKAQASRGVDFKNGGIKAKAKSMITLIIPLFVSAFAKAEDLGNAMETRGYDPYEKRTRYREYPITTKDVFVSILMAGLLTLVILSHINQVPFPQWWV